MAILNDFEKLFADFDLEKYYRDHAGNKEYDWGKPVGQEII